MVQIRDIFGRQIHIPQERWEHACIQHPELEDFFEEVVMTLENPDLIKMSSTDRKVRLYYRFFATILGGKYVLVVIKTNQRNFLLTAYITDYIKAGEELWQRKN